MSYLITQMLICLLLAAAIGFVLGWFLRGMLYGQTAEDVDDTATTYAIEDIEGIGPAFGKRLRDMGIETTQDLVDRGRNAADRKSIAERISVDDETITQWTRMADLMRVAGVDLKTWNASLTDLEDIDVGSHFASEFTNARVPTLSDVLADPYGACEADKRQAVVFKHAVTNDAARAYD